MRHMNRSTRIYDPRDPKYPYDDDFTEEDDELLWESEVEKEIDERIEREALQEG